MGRRKSYVSHITLKDVVALQHYAFSNIRALGRMVVMAAMAHKVSMPIHIFSADAVARWVGVVTAVTEETRDGADRADAVARGAYDSPHDRGQHRGARPKPV